MCLDGKKKHHSKIIKTMDTGNTISRLVTSSHKTKNNYCLDRYPTKQLKDLQQSFVLSMYSEICFCCDRSLD